ncbi:MAG: hypothetical protein PSX80_01145 [bacterium]|nr:hypothetical protein [bacterium]
MRNTVNALIVLAVLFAASVTAQTVTITGQKKTYTRVKPIRGYKKNFTINRPAAKAATPAMSRKITSLIDPVNVLEIDLKEELTETQWLSEADFEEVFNEQGVLTVMLWMEGSAAYSDGVTKYVVVDVANGVRLAPTSAFVDLPGLIAAVKKKQDAEIEKASKAIRANPEFAADDDPKRLFEETTFGEKDLVNFAVDRAGVAFFYDYGFPNVIKALEPDGELRLSWFEVKPFIIQDGLLARFIH